VVRWSPTDRAYFLRVRPEMQTARQAEVRNAAGAGQAQLGTDEHWPAGMPVSSSTRPGSRAVHSCRTGWTAAR